MTTHLLSLVAVSIFVSAIATAVTTAALVLAAFIRFACSHTLVHHCFSHFVSHTLSHTLTHSLSQISHTQTHTLSHSQLSHSLELSHSVTVTSPPPTHCSEPVRAALGDTLLYWRVLLYFVNGGSYSECPHLANNVRVKVYLHSLALIFFLWDKPHYRSGTFQNDMIKNLRNVAFPGTGVPLDWLCRSRLVFTAFLFAGMPLVFAAYALVLTRQRSAAAVCDTYRQLLLEPEPWFAYWRLNCRLASYHALLTQCTDYQLEDKWTFLVAAEQSGVPVSPFLKAESIVCKDRNEEGGMGIHFFKNALHGGAQKERESESERVPVCVCVCLCLCV